MLYMHRNYDEPSVSINNFNIMIVKLSKFASIRAENANTVSSLISLKLPKGCTLNLHTTYHWAYTQRTKPCNRTLLEHRV